MSKVQSSKLEVPPQRGGKRPRAWHLLALDAGMLALACVLESLSLTGLAWHEWLGFVLCVLVLFHVILQLPWFVTVFRRVFSVKSSPHPGPLPFDGRSCSSVGKGNPGLTVCIAADRNVRAPVPGFETRTSRGNLSRGANRSRVNLVLNFLLFIVMVAVLVSGVLISNQMAPLVGGGLGRPRVWSELHSWLNFTLIVLVGVHLAMNWDWVLGAIRRRTVPLVRMPGVPGFLFRGAMVLIVAGFVAAGAYASMAAMMKPSPSDKRAAVQMTVQSQPPRPRQGRSQSFRNGFQELDITVLVIAFVAVVGRFVLRIRL